VADIVILGAGVVGLGTALLLAEDGHQVTVLERDPQAPPSPLDAWDNWCRRGVNQFRLPHFFMARYRTILETELPQVAKAIEAAGGRRYNPLLAIPDLVRGPERPEDHDVEVLTGRRPLVESAFAAVAATHPGLTIRRGATIGMLHGLALRDRLRDVGLGDPYAFARCFHHTTTKDIEPWFTSVRAEDRHRLAEIDAGIRGEEYRPADRWWELDQALRCAAACDPDCLRAFVRAALMIEPLAHALTSDGVADRIRELGANWRDEPVPAPGRDQLVALAND